MSACDAVLVSGRYSVNVLPTPGSLRTFNRPLSSCDSSRLIDSPSPVPPYLRLVVPSACWNASKITDSFSAGMPMPVSRTSNASMDVVRGHAMSGASCGCACRMCRSIPPSWVNFTALDSRLRRICCNRCSSVCSVTGTSGSTLMWNSRPFSAVIGRHSAST